MLGFHLNPFIALIIVLSLVVAIPYGLKRFRDKLPSLLKNGQTQKKALSINEILPIDNKRRLVAVNIADGNSTRKLLLLTGGNNDLVVDYNHLSESITITEKELTANINEGEQL